MALRSGKLLCGCIIGFAQSNPFDHSKPFYNKSLSYALPEATDNILLLTKIATNMVNGLYQKDVAFKKCGVMLIRLEPKGKHVYDLFTDVAQIEESNQLMNTLEEIQYRFGKSKLSLGASMLPNRTWKMSRDNLSPNYFKWNELLTIR